MEFKQAMKSLENGMTIRRPLWKGYLFLDTDGNVKHVGSKPRNEILWKMDITKDDWEEYMTIENLNVLNSEFNNEIESSRIETLMDQNSSHIKRLYYLEDMIEDHHKSVKRLVDNMTEQMELTRKSLANMTKFITNIREDIKIISSDCGKIKSQQVITDKLSLDNKFLLQELLKRIVSIDKTLKSKDKDKDKLVIKSNVINPVKRVRKSAK